MAVSAFTETRLDRTLDNNNRQGQAVGLGGKRWLHVKAVEDLRGKGKKEEVPSPLMLRTEEKEPPSCHIR